ncbi:MAG: GyrI-like domain-containing protein [Pseudonocardia sp.]|uniref:GyrI-like domain-containing protein n=1 Tax=unclassified Pseudonocardia TaxID=2619320 RepID=UPI00086A59E2|nr:MULTISPECIES: GyrI-like domain-containing protein [unclassified Pseudonocardia]MBN9111719.1 GyrI-like domain-containing protein [Pseudonocardia sp.]ODU25544.1 MAG: transcription activator effector-binding protein [Pseudonocardia sp. SCN 72-51]ODV02303.1 MAG: transcription activator effector-binding protein [Pseudonocardia sp. SCN 73-27]
MVVEEHVEARPTLVVTALTGWDRFPAEWPGMLDEVWAHLRANGVDRGCRNVMLHRDTADGVHVEVGVLAAEGVAPAGRVVASTLPAGRVATTVHRGPYAGLGETHRAVGEWCRASRTSPAGVRWEVYGPHHDDPAQLWVEVAWLLGS